MKNNSILYTLYFFMRGTVNSTDSMHEMGERRPVDMM